MNKKEEDVADPATTASLKMAESDDEEDSDHSNADTIVSSASAYSATTTTKTILKASSPVIPNQSSLPTIDSTATTHVSATKNPLMLKHRKASVRKLKKEKGSYETPGAVSKSPRPRLKNTNSSPTEMTKKLARRQTDGPHVVALNGSGSPAKSETPRLRQTKSSKLVKGISSKNILLRHLDNRPTKT